MACHNKTKTLPIQCHLMFLRQGSECFNITRFGMRLSRSYFEKLTTGPMKSVGRYVHGKLKMWKERIKSNFHGQDVPYDMYCNATAVLKIDSICKQGKSYHPQVYVEECKYTGPENQQCNMLSGDEDRFFEV